MYDETPLSMGMGKSIPPPLPDREEYMVDFDGMADPAHPWNWQRPEKYVTPPPPPTTAGRASR